MTYETQSQQLLVADKTGEVYSFPFPIPPHLQQIYSKSQSLPPPDDKHPLTKPTDERFLGTFILGHSSSIVAMTLLDTKWGRALVTGDRDEHVRISVYPSTHVIHAMGLGHSAFVSALLALEEGEGRGGVVSGAGDMRVIHWDGEGRIIEEGGIESGSCVRWIRRWGDRLLVVGEGYFLSLCVGV